MLDPLSLLGAASAVGAVVAGITTTVRDLTDLRAKLQGADFMVGLLISELSTVKAALIQIEDWAKYNASRGPVQADLASAFDVSLDGCQAAMDVLAMEVSHVLEALSPSSSGPTFMFRARFAWNEASMREHQQRLQTQIGALQLLIQAFQIRTLPGQAALLREPKSKKIMQKVKDDTDSIHSSMASSSLASTHVGSTRAGSIRSASPVASTIGVPTIASMNHHGMGSRFDAQYRMPAAPDHGGVHYQDRYSFATDEPQGILRTTSRKPQEPHRQHHYGHVTPRERLDVPVTNDSTDNETTQPAAKPTQRLRIQIPEQPPKTPRPNERSAVSEPASVGTKRDNGVTRSASASSAMSLGAVSFQVQPKSADSKSSFWNSVKRRTSRAALSRTTPKPVSPISPSGSSPVARRAARFLDAPSPNVSVKFMTEEDSAACPLVLAAQSGLYDEVKRLLDQGVDIEQMHAPSRRTALAVAAHCGHDDIVSLLLQFGANVNTRDEQAQTPLHLAASRGQMNAVQDLLEDRADVDATDRESKTPLRLACDEGHFGVAMVLLQSRAKVSVRDQQKLTALHAAAKAGNQAMINVLVANGADVEAKDSNMMSALHYAAERDHDSIVEALLNRKNLDCPGKDGMTPLSCASSTGATQTVRFLIRKGASTRQKSDGGMTALHWASHKGHSDVVDLLLQKRIPIDAKTNDGKTALHLAVQSGSFSTAELLVRKGAALEAQCKRSLRPLHYACLADDLDLVQLLLGSGAEIEPGTSLPKNTRPFHMAISAGSLSAVNLLLDRGAPIDTRTGTGDRSLCLAAKSGNFDLTQVLITRGASVELRDAWDWAPLAYAAFYGHPAIVDLLLRHGASIDSLNSFRDWDSSASGATRMGFAMDAGIDEDRKAQVITMVNDVRTHRRQQLDAAVRLGENMTARPAAAPVTEANRTSQCSQNSDFKVPLPGDEPQEMSTTRFSWPFAWRRRSREVSAEIIPEEVIVPSVEEAPVQRFVSTPLMPPAVASPFAPLPHFEVSPLAPSSLPGIPSLAPPPPSAVSPLAPHTLGDEPAASRAVRTPPPSYESSMQRSSPSQRRAVDSFYHNYPKSATPPSSLPPHPSTLPPSTPSASAPTPAAVTFAALSAPPPTVPLPSTFRNPLGPPPAAPLPAVPPQPFSTSPPPRSRPHEPPLMRAAAHAASSSRSANPPRRLHDTPITPHLATTSSTAASSSSRWPPQEHQPAPAPAASSFLHWPPPEHQPTPAPIISVSKGGPRQDPEPQPSVPANAESTFLATMTCPACRAAGNVAPNMRDCVACRAGLFRFAHGSAEMSGGRVGGGGGGGGGWGWDRVVDVRDGQRSELPVGTPRLELPA